MTNDEIRGERRSRSPPPSPFLTSASAASPVPAACATDSPSPLADARAETADLGRGGSTGDQKKKDNTMSHTRSEKKRTGRPVSSRTGREGSPETTTRRWWPFSSGVGGAVGTDVADQLRKYSTRFSSSENYRKSQKKDFSHSQSVIRIHTPFRLDDYTGSNPPAFSGRPAVIHPCRIAPRVLE